MDSDTTHSRTSNDPVSAFEALRGEVSLLRRAVEGLTAERQNVPDYTPTLRALSGRLTRIEAFMGEVSESPAMQLTPESLAASIVNASEATRAGDRDIIETASATLRASIASIDRVVEQAWAADRQRKQLCWTAAGAFLFGALSASILPQLIG